MADLRSRAVELSSQPGMTPLRAFRVLRREFPSAERDMLVRASRLRGAPTGYLPSWAQRIGEDGKIHPNGALLRPVIAKKPPRSVKR